MAFNFNDDQKKALKANGTVLVSAAAGSGKTAVLTQRVVNIICDKSNGIDADQLLIVTFTNAAAAELRSRIQKSLNEQCALYGNDPYYSKQKLLLQSAKICSIDAFCLDIVRKNFSILNIEPDFDLVDDANENKFKNIVLDDILLKYYSKKDSDFDFLGRIFGIETSENLLKEAVFKIYNYAMTLPQPKKWLKSASDMYNDAKTYEFYSHILLDNLVDLIDETIALCEINSREVIGYDVSAKYLAYYDSCVEYMKDIRALIKDKKYDEVLSVLNKMSLPNATLNGCNESESVKKLIKRGKEIVTKNVNTVISDVKSAFFDVKEVEQGRATVSKLCEIVECFYDEFFAYLKQRKVFTFSMVEHLALELLCMDENGILVPSEISTDLCKNFKQVLVDEYQDNNDLQDALFFAVSDGGKNLFMVGDVKQCVYGFRNANPDNFLRYKEEFPEYTEDSKKSKIFFKSNYRSRKGVCEFVNAVLKSIMIPGVSGMSYGEDDKLISEAIFPEMDRLDTEVHLIDNMSGENNYEIEAEEIAKFIEQTMNEGNVIRDKDTLRPAKYSDFTILLRYPGSKHSTYENALKRHSIPVSVMSDDFVDSPEVMSVLSLLKVIDNPSRDVPLAAVMTSPFFAMSYDDLVAIKQKGNGLYASVVLLANEGDVKCKALLDELSVLRSRIATEPLGRFIADICDEYLITAIYGRLGEFDAVNENINRLVSLADSYYSTFGNDLAGFIDNLERQDSSETDGLSNNFDSVKITSFHKSKGLQFPVCILAGLGGLILKKDLEKRFVFSNLYGVSIKQPGDKDFVDNVAGKVIKHHRLKQLIAEEIRIFYVALTRAEDRLAIFGTSKSLKDQINEANSKLTYADIDNSKASVKSVLDCKTYLDLLLLGLVMQCKGKKILDYADLQSIATADDTDFKLSISEYLGKQESGTVFGEEDKPRIAIIRDEKIEKSIREKFEFEYPYESDCNTQSKFAVTQLVHGDSNEYAFTINPSFMSKSGLTPAQRGTAMHKFMQFADYSRAEHDAKGELERLKEWEYISEEEADSIEIGLINLFFKSDIYVRMKQSVKMLREYKFMVEYPYNDTKTIVQGIADCVFEEDDGFVIFDFKSDSVKDSGELLERYKKQLEIYKFAIEQIFDKKVKECVLYSLKLGTYVSFKE